jgi:hypothetical protein
MRSNNPARTRPTDTLPCYGKVLEQPVAGKVMGLPVGAAAPSNM